MRIAIETAAIERLLNQVEEGSLADYSSEMAQVEIERMPDADRRRKVAALLPDERRNMPLSPALIDVAEELQRAGFGSADAVHLAAAVRWKVDVFPRRCSTTSASTSKTMQASRQGAKLAKPGFIFASFAPWRETESFAPWRETHSIH